MNLTASEISSVLEYEPETGVFRWKTDQGRAVRGALAGHVHKSGYRQIKVNKKLYMAHRLAWVLVHGEAPSDELDHINGVRDDNRIANLREVSRSLNMENIRRPRVDNKLGVLGVQRNGSGFKAEITVAGNRKHLGTFRSIEEARNAYINAKRSLHAGCTI